MFFLKSVRNQGRTKKLYKITVGFIKSVIIFISALLLKLSCLADYFRFTVLTAKMNRSSEKNDLIKKKLWETSWENGFEKFARCCFAKRQIRIKTRKIQSTTPWHFNVGYKISYFLFVHLFIHFSGAFINMLILSMRSVMQFGFLFLIVYIPYVCMIYLLFGGNRSECFSFYKSLWRLYGLGVDN